jgi:hypothetical protein
LRTNKICGEEADMLAAEGQVTAVLMC